ncbi:hypothetical protein [Pararhodobacter sp.]
MIPILRHLAFLCLCLLVAVPGAGAQQVAGGSEQSLQSPALQRLAALLADLPAPVVSPQVAGGVLVVSDLAATRRVLGAEATDRQVAARGLDASEIAAALAAQGGGGSQGPAAGFAFEDVESLVALAAPPVHLAVINLRPGTGAGVAPALEAQGYSWAESHGVRALAVGADGETTPQAGRFDDPFRGSLGRSARIVIEGDRLRSASHWQLAALLAAAPGMPADRSPDLAPLLVALDRALATQATDAAAVLRGVLWTDGAGIGAHAPSAAAMRAALLVDLSDGADLVTALALRPSAPVADPQALAGTVEARWREATLRSGRSLEAHLPGPVQVTVQGAPDAPVLTLVLRRPGNPAEDGAFANPAFELLRRAIDARDLPLFD